MSMTDKSLIDENEWKAQERGLRAALGRDAGGLDAAAMSYRVVSEALMSTPRSGPPDDFAAGVVKRVARHDAGLERFLSRILLVVFLVASAIVGVQYGEQWWQALHRTLSGDALGWVLAAMGCVTLSWMGNRLHELAGHAGDPGHAS